MSSPCPRSVESRPLMALLLPRWRRVLTTVLAALTLGLGVASPPAQAVELTTAPQPRIEAGMHTAAITAIATDAKGRWAVTASADKTARLWDLLSGRLLGVIRPPQDQDHEGKLTAVAMSPDGRRIAVAGLIGLNKEDKGSIYIYQYDPVIDQLRWERRIDGVMGATFHLAFSPGDGRWLVASLSPVGVRVYDARNGLLVGKEQDNACQAIGLDFVRGSDIAVQGVKIERNEFGVVSTCVDGDLRAHIIKDDGALLGPILVTHLDEGKKPFGSRVSPDGSKVAVGFMDSRFVRILGLSDFSGLMRLNDKGKKSEFLHSVAWAGDGSSVAAAGGAEFDGSRMFRRWSTSDGRWLSDTRISNNTVTDLQSLPASSPVAPTGGWLFTAEDPTWGVINAQAQVVYQKTTPIADFRDQYDKLKVSFDSRRIQFGYRYGGANSVVFDVTGLMFDARSDVEDLSTAIVSTGDLNISEWRNRRKPLANGSVIALPDGEISRSLALDAFGANYILGTEFHLRSYDRKGKLLWKQPAPGQVWAVNLSRDGRWVVAAYADGTIRWHRVADGQEVLAFFPHNDRKRWVLWTPEGFYAASAPRDGVGGGDELLGYHINRGRDAGGDFVTAAQLSETFNNPALVSKRLTPEGDALMAEAVKTIGTVDDLLARAQSLPPALTVTLPSSGRLEGDTEVTVEMTLEDRGGGIGPVRLFVNRRVVEGRQGASNEGVTVKRSYTLRLPPGAQTIELQPTSLRGVAGNKSAPIPALLRGAQSVSTLHILAVGVQAYQDKSLNPLAHSVSDARDVADEIARRAQPLFKTAVPAPIVLTEQQATREGIDAAFEQLRARMKPDDTLVIFLAGHGQARIGTYTYLPWDYQPGATGKRGEGLNEKRLFEMLQQSPARTLLLIDTCDAGGMVDMLAGAYQRMSKERQRPVIGAARKGEFAREGYKGHGVFSAALLDVLGADGRGKSLSVVQLHSELAETVDEFSKKMPGNYFQTVTGLTDNGAFPVVRR